MRVRVALRDRGHKEFDRVYSISVKRSVDPTFGGGLVAHIKISGADPENYTEETRTVGIQNISSINIFFLDNERAP